MAVHSNRTVLKKASTTVGTITKVSGPNKTRSKKETSHLDLSDWTRTFIAGLKDPGDITFDLLMTKAKFDLLHTDYEADDGGLATYTIELPDGSSASGPAFVQNLGREVDLDGIISCPVTLACTGKWTFTAGA